MGFRGSSALLLGLLPALAACGDKAGSSGSCWYADADGDGFGDPAAPTADCAVVAGAVSNDDDCDDTDPELTPSTRWFADADADGYGAEYNTTIRCSQPQGYVRVGGDCDDKDATLNPETRWFADGDGDGFGDPADYEQLCKQPAGSVAIGDDCDDADPTIFPGAPELCDGVDQDCDGQLDVEITAWEDLDGDGYGNPEGESMVVCEAPEGFADNDLDCNDRRAAINPDAFEVCGNTVDEDCDGVESCGVEGVLGPDDADVRLAGSAGSALGTSVAGLEDTNRDGFDDFVVGSPLSGVGGEVRVYEGGEGVVDPGDFLTISSANAGDQFGAFVGPGGDFNGDGYADLVVGAPTWGSKDQGAHFLFFGPLEDGIDTFEVDASLIGSATSWFGVGRSASGTDGAFAFTAADPSDEWSVGLFQESFSGAKGFADAPVHIGGLPDVSGRALYPLSVSLGDLDADGVTDLVIGSPDYAVNNKGSVFFFSDSAGLSGELDAQDADVVINGLHASYFGASVQIAPDMDSDGLGELLIGAPGRSTRTGAAYVYWGSQVVAESGSSLSYSDADCLLSTDPTSAGISGGAGASVRAVRDMNGDRVPDILVGAPGADKAYLVLGPPSASMNLDEDAFATLEGGSESGTGASVGDAGDTNGDGYWDLLVGVPGDDAALLLLGGP